MAYAALLSVAEVIEEILKHDHQDYTFLCGKDQMISLHQNIISLQQFLEHVPMKYTSMMNQFESRLVDVVYQVEDIIEASTMELPGDDRLSPSAFCRCIEEVSSILQESEEMKELFEKNKGTTSSIDDSGTKSSLIVEPAGSNDAKVGLDEGLKQILERVNNREKPLQIIPVVGMGGIGKTTLARAVYDSPFTSRHFDVYFWVTVSQEYSIQDILLELIPDKPNAGKIKPNVESLIVQVYKSLYNRRFLIILDDMWDAKAWDGIMRAIPDNNNSSRVIITTRLSDVAAKVDYSSPLYQMQLLHKETAWDLLRAKVFGQESCLPELEGVGRRIAENCKGLPLLIVVVAGLLKSNRTEDYWEEVARNINEAAVSNDQIEGILSLSYKNLPMHLKACFLSLGAFPEDARISVSTLIRLWIAEGFVRPRAPETLEEIAEEYLEDLVERNLVLVTGKRCNGKIRTCSIHDVPRELSLRKAQEEKFLKRFAGHVDDVAFRNITMSQRHVSISTYSFDTSTTDVRNTFARSLICIDCPAYLQLSTVALRFRLLKVLSGVWVYAESMMRQIFDLTNLRLLQFSCYNDFGSTLVVPKSISRLQKLETLIVTEGSRASFPVDIWKIPKLRHIVLSRECTLPFPVFSQGYPVLEHLQTLSWAKNVKFNKNLVRRIPNLKKFRYLYGDYYGHLTLAHLCQLENMYLAVDSGSLPDNCVFPPNLKKLTLERTRITSWEHMSSMVGSLPNLEVLKLKDFSVQGEKWEPREDEFLGLKYLEMRWLDLKYWLADSTHFPCLETLFIRGAYYLEEIPPGIGSIETLQKLIVKSTSMKVEESAHRIREEQENFGNDALQVFVSESNNV